MFQPSAETINNAMQFRSVFFKKFQWNFNESFELRFRYSSTDIPRGDAARVRLELLIKDGRFERLYPK
jgi:hypothetical protein